MKELLGKKILELVKKDAKKADIQSTAEGKGFLRSRYLYWKNKV